MKKDRQPLPAPRLYRRRETAARLGFSEGQIIKWERAGILPVIRIPGVRAARHRAEVVDKLADDIIAGRLVVGAPDGQ